jgi:hypothetical protein
LGASAYRAPALWLKKIFCKAQCWMKSKGSEAGISPYCSVCLKPNTLA